MPTRHLADSTGVKLRRVLHLACVLLFTVLWATPTLAQDEAFETYRKEVLAITSKYPDHAIPRRNARISEKQDAVRLDAIAHKLSRLDSKKYPIKISQHQRLSILMKDASPVLSLLFASHSKQPHYNALIEEWMGRPTEAGRENREKIESGRTEAIQILEKYAPNGGPRLTRGTDEREAAVKLVNIGQLLHRLNPLRYPENKDFLKNVHTGVRETRSDLAGQLEKLLAEQAAEALEREKVRAGEVDPQLDLDRSLLERRENVEKKLQSLRIQAHGIFVKYEATGGPRLRARLGEAEPSRVENLDADLLQRIALKLQEVDPSHYERTSGRINLARLFSTIPGEGKALEDLLELRVNSPDFPARLAAWRKIRGEIAVVQAPNELVHLETLRQEVIRILDNYRTIGRPRATPSDRDQDSAANRLVRLGRNLAKHFPNQFGTLEPRSALAQLIEATDPHGAEILRLEVRSPEFKEAVRLRNGVAPLSAQSEKRILAYQEEVLSIYEAYASQGGPSVSPTDPDSPEGKREISAARRLNVISLGVGGLDPNRFLPTAQKENLARLVEDAPGGGKELAQVIRSSRQSDDFKRSIRDWRTAQRRAAMNIMRPPSPPKVARPAVTVQTNEPTQAAQSDEPPAASPEKSYPDAVRAFLDRYKSVDAVLNDVLRVYREFRDTGGPIEWNPPATPGQKRERSAARMLVLLNHRLQELDTARFSDPSKLGNLARAIEIIPGDGPALAELVRTDRSKDPALYERRRKIWIAVRDEENFINCLTNAAR